MACHDGHLLSATYAVLQSSLPEPTELVVAYAVIYHRAQSQDLAIPSNSVYTAPSRKLVRIKGR